MCMLFAPSPRKREIMMIMKNKTCDSVVLTVWFGGCRQRTSKPRRTENAMPKLCSS